MKALVRALMLVGCFGGSVRADCEPPHAIHTAPNVTITQVEIDARYSAYLALCTKVGGDLIDTASVTNHDRIGNAVLAEVPSVDTYPRDLLRKGISGVVSVAAVVDTTGKVSDVMLLSSSGNKEFDGNALDQIRHYKYRQPYTLDGVPVRVFKTYAITYHTR